ncbi:MAG: type II secretion system protein GspG [Kiritimatiellae bacterium]|nr:type II secretion system protein GspG [Kiritimatiellia bacterium]MDD5521281.1 type II secretion system protein GspG [Kiritimatiellia bacterium]
MNNRKQREEKNRIREAGFSLIEIMLVVAIMGMLAALVAVGLGGRREKAMINASRTSIAAMCTAIDLYEVDTGKLPDSLENLLRTTGEPNWSGPYIKGAVIQPDPWASPFSYAKKGDHSYEVRSAGPDRQPNTEDDITN